VDEELESRAIGGYKVRKVIATGQTSQVLEVVEIVSGRHMAMKMLLPAFVRDSILRKQMLHEAEVGIKLAHDNIIKIMKVSKDPKQVYFVMEYFAAGSMGFRVLNKHTDFIKQHAQGIFKQAATALAYMHGSGWVHRDIKPDNILVDSAGQAKVIDFAISQRMKQDNSGGWLGLFMGSKPKPQGTPSYMSPEQIRNLRLDERADIYSYGATVYEIITGRPPFRGASLSDLLNKHISEKVLPPHGLNPEVTDDFSNLVVKMLAKDPKHRPSNFHEIMMAMKNLRVFKSGAGKSKT